MKTNIFRAGWPILLASASLLVGCGGISEVTKERVARSETTVQQAQQNLGTSEQGAVELQKARDQLERAKRALDDEKEEAALRHAQEAELTAELAIARAESASARRAAEELQASIRTLREEAERGTTTATDVP